MSKVVLKCENLNKKISKKMRISNISFTIYENDILGFIGPNGAGKTTIIKLLLGLYKYDTGIVEINGYDLKKDLLRRDFTINTLCIDKDENLLDLLSCKQDIDLRIIKTVGNPRYRIKEDSLRILRAIRFAGTLNFSIDEKTMNYIKKYGYLLKKLSYSRKMDELKKIFSSKNKEKSRELIISLGIDKYLEIDNLADIVLCDDIMGIWSQLKMSSKYPFSKVEKSMISNIKKMLLSDLDSYTVYKYGLYVSTVVGSIKGIDYKKINDIYYDLPIYSRKDINIKGTDISYCLNREPGNYIGKIIDDIERLIVMKKLENKKEKIICYVKNNY